MIALRLALVAAASLTPAMAGAPNPPATAADTVAVSIDASKPGAKIDRNIFGQFAELLGTGIYEGVWVGPDSPIPNTRGIRNDVVAALKALKVPNVRWPGGCFADEYHWRKGIGQSRPATLNPNWGGVIEPNTFGTNEFVDWCRAANVEPLRQHDQLGALRDGGADMPLCRGEIPLGVGGRLQLNGGGPHLITPPRAID